MCVVTIPGSSSAAGGAGRKFFVSFQTLSGDVRTDFPVASGKVESSTARLVVETMSGDVVVHAADWVY